MGSPTPEALLELWKTIASPQRSSAEIAEALARGAAQWLGDVVAVRFRVPLPVHAWEAVRVGPGAEGPVRAGAPAEATWLEAVQVDVDQLVDLLTVPLTAAGEVMGTLAVGRSRSAGGERFSPADEALAQRIAEGAAGAMDGALVRARERWMRLWFESCPSVIFYKDEALQYRFVNEGFLKLSPPREKVINRTDADLFPPEVAAYFATVDRQVLQSGQKAVNTDKIVIHGDMTVRLALKFPIKDETGQVVGVGGNVTQIPDIGISNQALKAVEEQINFVTDPLPGLISCFSVDQRIRFANVAHEAWLGMPRLDMVGKTLKEVFGEPAYAQMRPHVERALQGERCAFDLELRRSDGMLRDTTVTLAPQRGLLREMDSVVCLIVDRTEEKRAEDRVRFLAESGSLFGASLDLSSIVKTIAALAVPRLADWCVVEIRPGEGWSGQVVVSHVDHEKMDSTRQLYLWLAAQEDQPPQIATVLQTGSPELVPCLTEAQQAAVADPEARRLFGEVGLSSAMVVPLSTRMRIIGAITLVGLKARRRYDPLDLAHAEELARRAGLAMDNARLYKEVQAAVELRDEFLAVAGHELRTPLAALSLLLDTLVMETNAIGTALPALARFQNTLARSKHHSERLGRLIGQLLDVSRIQMRRLQLQPELVDLGKLVEEVTTRYADAAAQARCDLEVHIQPEPVVGFWDPLQLDQVTTNLLTNALKYGAGKPVEVSVTASNGKALLSVKDHGIGISPTDQERIFGRFERAVSQRHYGGLGLGLWITRQALEAMGGSIRVQSTPNVETLFVAELPIRPGTKP
jgi:PAS domain S-box-containing protein